MSASTEAIQETEISAEKLELPTKDAAEAVTTDGADSAEELAAAVEKAEDKKTEAKEADATAVTETEKKADEKPAEEKPLEKKGVRMCVSVCSCVNVCIGVHAGLRERVARKRIL
eukprot:GHVU01219730.1.p3 GENE.GHVU01219730.1~~GHVU01219730.1.p3  ORF type:complete len:115 (+),score=29.92 GHVU01219730.1:121-465(+)